ncbi:MAG: dihydrofolate reductase [Gammaproteobacteria bacterium]
MSEIVLVAAVAENGVIGQGGVMPWHLPADLAHFKRVTWGHPILMGRRTFEAIGRALPGRRNIVLTRDPDFSAPGIETASSLEQALERIGEAAQVMVIGGAELYRIALPLAQRIYLTRIHASPEGDTFFPDLIPTQWRQLERKTHPTDKLHPYALSFIELGRVEDNT